MSDYIKREDAIEAFDPKQRRDWYTPWIIETLKDLPSADVAPVVRCKDCRWWNDGTQMCGITISATPYGHCHDGERKDNG